MAWVYLIVAGGLEIIWAVGLKYTDGFTRPVPSAIAASALVASVVLLSLALRDLPVGTAYAIWTGIGITGTAILGMALLGDSASAPRLVCIALVVTGIAGLKILA